MRVLWAFVEQLDLSPFQGPIKAVEGHPGAPVVPASLLFALWLLATIEGIGSARVLTELCGRDLPYQWLCGGEAVNYHTLSDFYSCHGVALRQLFTEHIAALRQQGLITLQTVTLDGRKVAANASKDCFRREGTLERHLQEATEHVQQVAAAQAAAGAVTTKRAAAQRRGARERQQRLQRAVAVVRQRQEHRRELKRASSPPEQARANETDPDVAKMKLPDGGYRQAYNVETMTDTAQGLIVCVAVTNQGSDNGQLGVMARRLEQEQGTLPKTIPADSGFVDQADIEWLEAKNVQVLMPPKNAAKEKQQGKDPYARKKRDSEPVAQWRGRMGQVEAQQAYRCRAPVAEGVHAQQANRGWRRFRLRGLVKAGVEALWQALGHNLARLLSLEVALARTVRAAPA